MNPLLRSPVIKKMIMALTGQAMVLFVIIHVLGNSSMYVGWLNAYAAHLHSLPFLLWVFRLTMMSLLLLHLVFGIVLTLENRSAKNHAYTKKKTIEATFAGRYMIWSGAVIGAFILYHLLHFTVQIVNPEISAKLNFDAFGRPDVLKMVVLNFQKLSILLVYTVGLTALFLHLIHGIQSSLQTLGLNTERTMPVVLGFGSVAALILFLGYIAIPVIVYFGMVRT